MELTSLYEERIANPGHQSVRSILGLETTAHVVSFVWGGPRFRARIENFFAMVSTKQGFARVFLGLTEKNEALVKGLHPQTENEILVLRCLMGYKSSCGNGRIVKFRTVVGGNYIQMFPPLHA